MCESHTIINSKSEFCQILIIMGLSTPGAVKVAGKYYVTI